MNRELLTLPDLWFQINAEICARPRKAEKVTMKLNARSYWLALLLLMMSAVPAVAQFEVGPDHFNENPSNSRQVARSNSRTEIKLQVSEQKKLPGPPSAEIRSGVNPWPAQSATR